MKKICVLIVFLSFSVLSFGQENHTTISDTEVLREIKVEQPVLKKSNSSAEIKAKILKINRKKSNEIISIKAYRKSLQIKVKTVKLC